jgi:hypothetical protein
MLFPDAIFRPRDSFAAETPGKSPNSENPDTTWQTPLLFLESKSLLEQNCCRLAASHLKASSWSRICNSSQLHSRRFFHEFPIHRSGQASFSAQPGGPFELGAVTGVAGTRSAAVDADYQ